MEMLSLIWKMLVLVCCQNHLCHFSFKPSGILCTFEKLIVMVSATFLEKNTMENFSIQTWLLVNEQYLKE